MRHGWKSGKGCLGKVSVASSIKCVCLVIMVDIFSNPVVTGESPSVSHLPEQWHRYVRLNPRFDREETLRLLQVR